ncbi:autotransporter-associated beta strand repeat-containing protein [Flavobacterium sp. TR2]|uniref:autotransporter-associated beta strand repeat-containing protein n=1 Tax=Flavobacterium sp. TR2 TaxID=2977321 RepID=UPI0021B0DFD1|nr:autotransporter-associated beta strand repeat-containing protein [Flavobacterium sp. TR2]UWY28024.1 autotransporter-associated beta strand repeat-containing protein [Flavobacterium sp. TR2]
MQSQVPTQQFWLNNQSINSLIWDNIASNGKIDNGSGNWDTNTANWLHSQTIVQGTNNTKWLVFPKCSEAVFGGNPGIGNAGTITLTEPITSVKSLSFRPAAGGNFTLTGGTLSPCATRFNIFTENALNVTIACPIIGTTGIIKTGKGTLNLTGVSSFAEPSFVKEGIVNLPNGIGFGAGGNIVNNAIVRYDCSQYVQNVTNNYATANGSTTGSISSATIEAYAPGQSGYVAAGTLKLTGNITQYGINGYGCSTISISSGNIHVAYISTGKGNSYGAAGYLVVDNATLTVDNYITSGEASGSGVNGGAVQATFNSGAVVRAKGFYANNANYGGDSRITVNQGATFLTGAANIGVRTYNLPIVLSGGTVGCWNENSNMGGTGCSLTAGTSSSVDTYGYIYTIGAVVSGDGSLVKKSAGTLVLNGNNTFTGGVTINGGIVKAGNVNAFGTGIITINAGATLNKNGFAIANTIVNNGGTIIP